MRRGRILREPVQILDRLGKQAARRPANARAEQGVKYNLCRGDLWPGLLPLRRVLNLRDPATLIPPALEILCCIASQLFRLRE